jgi:type II secretory pathway predicted ATPase ExeA
VGKTALLAYVRLQAQQRGVVTVALEADRGDGELVAARETLRRGAAELVDRADDSLLRRCGALRRSRDGGVDVRTSGTPAATLERLVADLGLLGAGLDTGVLLTVDEVQEAEQVLLKPLLRAAHLASQEDRPLGVLLSGLPSAAETLFDEGQTYTERLERVELGLLDRDGTVEAIRRPFEREADVLVDDRVLDHVHDEAGGYPWFVQLWGAALWDAARDVRQVDLEDARAAGVEVHERIQAFFTDRWRRVPTGRGAALAVALAEQGGDAEMGDLTEVLDLTHQALSPARRDLVERGLCWAPARGRLAFTVPGFAEWVTRTRPDRA